MALAKDEERGGWYVEDGAQRLKALRALLGISTPQQLAERIAMRGLGGQTIKNIEAGYRDRVLWDYEAEAIARRVSVPLSFFTAPLDRLGDVELGPTAAAVPLEVAEAHAAAARALDASRDATDLPAHARLPAPPPEAVDPERRERRLG